MAGRKIGRNPLVFVGKYACQPPTRTPLQVAGRQEKHAQSSCFCVKILPASSEKVAGDWQAGQRAS
jgi:hypothetical protein